MSKIALLILLSMSEIVNADSKCPEQEANKAATVTSSSRAIEIAKNAMLKTFKDDYLAGFEPFKAEKNGNIWNVYGSLPEDTRGGTPEGEVCATTGEVLDIYHSQ